MSLLSVRNLNVRFPVGDETLHAVRGLDMRLERGETLCIVGESGSGKSISSLAIADLLPANADRRADEMRFDGIDIVGLSVREMARLRGSRIGFVFQDPMTSLNPAWSIGNQLTEGFVHHRLGSRAEARARAVALLERVGIPNARHRLGQYPHQLSGGLRQRVMVAMALMCDPDLIFADEPTSALDVTIQIQLLELFREIQRERHLGLVLITHDLGVVSRIADRVAVIYAGQVVESGTARQIFGDPRHPYTRALLASMPGGKVDARGHLATIPGVVPGLIDPIPGCAFVDRCALAGAACRSAPPPMHDHRAHQWRCVIAPDGTRPDAGPAAGPVAEETADAL
ncbi:ABC transporter ATP-binding protein [Pseudogemmobacter sonorensis]|uniref:ABC transporter ATP-binding protein n=1 Tax=Pseudogemmobacter sonorensis TaxID=2989681 RepID=UPI0036B9C52C